MTRPVAIRAVTRFVATAATHDQDLVAVEEPISLVLHPHQGPPRPLGLLMRTPGHDTDLAIGVLVTEGVVRESADILRIECVPGDDTAVAARLDVYVGAGADADAISDRVGTATSACGLCGRLQMRHLDHIGTPSLDTPRVSVEIISGLPDRLRAAQHGFAQTGGLHAAGVFTPTGELVAVREDVGRHNAVDKIAGVLLQRGVLPARECILAVSGRIAYEIVQKAAMCGLPMIVAVGAPTDLAIDAARATGITLVGFTRDGRFNCYSHGGRIWSTGGHGEINPD